jgi:intein/homing endonuclease
MRIRLREGFQQKLILLAKQKNKFTWKKLAKRVGLNELYLSQELKNEKRLLSQKVYNILCEISTISYAKYIEKQLDDNWGRAKGGLNSTRKEELLVKEKSKELAELIGIILGDGNIWVKKGGYYYLTIVGDAKKDRNYLLEYVRPLVKKLFKKEMHIREHKTHNELFLYIGSKDIVFTLAKFGLKSGDKVKNNVSIPSWIFESDEYIRACIRGLIDTDGSVCPITGRNYPYIWFSSAIPNLRESFSKAMKQLGIRTSQWNIKQDRASDIYIGSKEMIDKYLKTISFKNQRHLNKILPL